MVEAERLYDQAFALSPNNATLLYFRGTLLLQTGRANAGIREIEASIRLVPNNADALYNLGLAYRGQGRLDDAIRCYQNALCIRPDYYNALYNIGNAYKDQGRLDDAIVQYSNILRIKPESPDALINLGNALQAQGKTEKAIFCYKEALRFRPDSLDALINIGLSHQEEGKLCEAIQYFTDALRMRPDCAEALNHLGVALQGQGAFDASIARLREALRLKPDYPEALNNLGNVLRGRGHIDEAVSCYMKALRIRPNFPDLRINFGNILKDYGRLNEAMNHYAEALRYNPNYADAHLHQSFILLLVGNFEAGWQKYEWRWKSKGVQWHNHNFPLWDGGRLDGKSILIHCEQGYGDSIQFVRYAKLIKELGAQVILYCPASLSRLFESVTGVDCLVVHGADIPRCDCQVPMLSLPLLVKTTVATIPSQTPYLTADPSLVEKWHNRFGKIKNFRVGIVWRGKPDHNNDANRSIAFEVFLKLFDAIGCLFIIMQNALTKDEISYCHGKNNVIDISEFLTDFAETAAAISCVDLVISVDTSVAHLAGALNIPVWTLLPFVPDWRWLLGRNDSVWYSSMKLFRQQKIGDWGAVIESLVKQIDAIVAHKRGGI